MKYACLNRLARVSSGATPSRERPEYWGGEIPWIGSGAVNQGVIEEATEFITRAGLQATSTRLYAPGTVMIALAGQGKTKATAAILGMKAAPNQSVAALECDQRYAEPRFVWYTLQADYERLRAEAGEGRDGLSQADIKAWRVPVPDPDFQRAIAAYLDRETARIDALVAAKERQLGLLQEREDAERRWLVAGGPAPEIRRGGADWIGDIPDHWEIMALKRACRLESGHTPRRSVPEYWDGGDIPWVSLADSPTLRRQDFIETTKDFTTQAGIDGSSAHVLPEGTVVFSRDATVGLCAILAIPMAVSQHFIGWVPTGKMQPEFTLAVVKAMNQKLESLRSGSTIPTIGMPHIEALQAPVPSIKEQEGIVQRLRAIRTQMGQARSTLQRSINGLRERRQALITHAVTGNLKVPIEVMP